MSTSTGFVEVLDKNYVELWGTGQSPVVLLDAGRFWCVHRDIWDQRLGVETETWKKMMLDVPLLKKPTQLALVSFSGEIQSKQARFELAKLKLVPAPGIYSLALGAQAPPVSSVAFIGDTFVLTDESYHRCVTIHCEGTKRNLIFHNYKAPWRRGTLFAGLPMTS